MQVGLLAVGFGDVVLGKVGNLAVNKNLIAFGDGLVALCPVLVAKIPYIVGLEILCRIVLEGSGVGNPELGIAIFSSELAGDLGNLAGHEDIAFNRCPADQYGSDLRGLVRVGVCALCSGSASLDGGSNHVQVLAAAGESVEVTGNHDILAVEALGVQLVHRVHNAALLHSRIDTF